ncbi:MAG: hypothetical protein ACJATT_003763 [Myxococcota bacterium]
MSTLSRAIVLLFASSASAVACDVVQPVGCDTSWAATIAGNDQMVYDCDPYLWDGDDLAVSFAATSTQLVRIDIRPGSWSNEPDVFVTENGCDGTCLAQSDDPQLDNTTVFQTSPGGDYLFHFDDYVDSSGFFGTGYNLEFDVWCSDGTCDPVFDVQDDLSCSSSQSGSTPLSVGNELKYYDCPDSAVTGFDPLWQTGPEAVYTFSPQASGDITFQLSGMSNDQDLYVLADSCDPSSCIAASTNASVANDSITFDAEAGRTYFIVVEGYDGPGTYDLDFDIGFGGCPEDCANGLDDDADNLVDCDDSDCWGEPECGCDNDGDGFDSPNCGGNDCDDGDSSVFPGASEVCNDVDDDCDGSADEGLTQRSYYFDNDGDNYGGTTSITDCAAPDRYVQQSGDCADGNPAINPGRQEVCNGIDDDCMGGIDNGITIPTWYLDGDSDSWGGATTVQACQQPTNYVGRGGDCADSNNAVFPGRSEVCNGIDDNCSGGADEGLSTFPFYLDNDSDQYGTGAAVMACRAPANHVSASGDCADNDRSRNPGAQEICDDIDQDCNGVADDGLATQTYYLDADGDTYGGSTTAIDCAAPLNYVGRGQDCVDTNPAINPAATDGCDGIDNDCDGEQDEDGDQAVWYADSDLDGFGGTTSIQQCEAPIGYVGQSGDCVDTSSAINPAATEICNGFDDNCDTLVDDNDPNVDVTSGSTWHVDADGDGYGGSVAVLRCEQPTDAVSNTDDCDDRAADRYPTNPEVCDGRDNDCDGVPDEDTVCSDDDGDGATENGGDCDDSAANVGPAAREVCDGVDQDCDGIIDETTGCYDDDDDGYTEEEGDCNDADPSVSPSAPELEGDGIDNDCDGSVDGGSFDPDGDGYSENGGDCVEGDPLAHPGAPERANGQDDDCDGIIDEETDSYDDDGDGLSELEGDCNDGNVDVAPGNPELPNGQDDDCDGIVDNGLDTVDDDGDGLSELEGDCDDANADVFPGTPETENGVDDDCDGQVDEDFIDIDRDGLSAADGDCDDTNGWVRPGRVDLCDGLDNNCDGAVDEGCDDTLTPASARCGCSASSTGWLGLWPLAGLALMFRRRRSVALGAVALVGCGGDSGVSQIDGRVSILPIVSDAGTVATDDVTSILLEVIHLSGPPVDVRAVDVFNIDGEMFSLFGELPTVQNRETGFIELVYAPDEAGYHRASITIITGLGGEAEVSVRGRAVDPAGGLYPGLVEFGRVDGGDTKLRDLRVVNDSELAWELRSIDVAPPFSVLGTFPIQVPAGETVSLDVAFEPIGDAPAIQRVTIDSNVPSLPLLTLRGNACQDGAPAAYDIDGDGITSCAGDCDDDAADVHPGATEHFDERDNDCDGIIDEGTVGYDDDNDGASENEGDCNDSTDAVGPFAAEVFGNGLDDDCDGVIDQGTTDGDSDGVSPGGGDCDDSRADVRPGARELADGVDNDCDGDIDEGTSVYDDDGDGYCESTLAACVDGALGGDCDDSNSLISPSGSEPLDGRDNNCNGIIDEGTRAYDDDGDSFTENGGDCDDNRPDVNPATGEVRGNGRDDDCNPATAD